MTSQAGLETPVWLKIPGETVEQSPRKVCQASVSPRENAKLPQFQVLFKLFFIKPAGKVKRGVMGGVAGFCIQSCLKLFQETPLLLNTDVDTDYITDFIATKIIPTHSTRPRGCQLREVLLHGS